SCEQSGLVILNERRATPSGAFQAYPKGTSFGAHPKGTSFGAYFVGLGLVKYWIPGAIQPVKYSFTVDSV
ncbi:MAG: hypothetical protein AB2798_13560, partial [Candidatus Thiodiazotropha endolucinida]